MNIHEGKGKAPMTYALIGNTEEKNNFGVIFNGLQTPFNSIY